MDSILEWQMTLKFAFSEIFLRIMQNTKKCEYCLCWESFENENKNDHSHFGWISEFQIETNKWIERASVTFYMNILIGRVSNNANQTYVA